MICPMFSDDCRFCSMEVQYHPCTYIIKKDMHFEPVRTGFIRVELGEFCNNDGTKFVADLHYCPARWAKTRPVKPSIFS